MFLNMTKLLTGNSYGSDNDVTSAVGEFFDKQDEHTSLNIQSLVYLEMDNVVITKKSWN